MRTRRHHLLVAPGAVVLVSVQLLAAAAPAGAAPVPTPPAFAFATTASATPVEADVYEPFIPIPATPQAEFELGYSKVVADSTSSSSRASFLWPGDAVGEGLKVILQTAGLPAADYPVQANASYPSSTTSDSQQPLPGATMTAEAQATGASGETSVSTTCDAPSATSSSRSGSSLALRPPASATSVAGAAPTGSDCQVPTQLAGLVQVAGYVSHSSVSSGQAPVVTRALASASEVSILDGLIAVSGVRGDASTNAKGDGPSGSARSTYASLRIAGTTVSLGSDGLVLPGQTLRAPGLPSDPNQLLKLLGVTLTVPQPVREVGQHALATSAAALVVSIDTSVLRSHLDVVPWSSLEDAINQLPDSLQTLKTLLVGAMFVSPRIVITVGKVSAGVQTADALGFPPLTGGLDSGFPSTTATSGTTMPGLGQAVPGAAGTSVGAVSEPAQAGPAALLAVAAGHVPPPLSSTPGGVVLLGLVCAAALASIVRRLGLAGLGGPSPLALPDLRKA